MAAAFARLLPEGFRARVADARGRGLYAGWADQHRAVFVHVPKTGGSTIAKTLFGLGSPIHATAHAFQRANPSKFSAYFKFAFVRNPWDRLVSAYYFYTQLPERSEHSKGIFQRYSDFGTFVRDFVTPENVLGPLHLRPQHQFVCDVNNRILVDFVGRYETFESDVAEVAKAIRLPLAGPLPKVNATDRPAYRECFDTSTRAIVERVYANDLELFSYEF